MPPPVLVEQKDAIALVTLNRPERRDECDVDLLSVVRTFGQYAA
ncbi:hypothetical protein [Novosphingobium beihaiensis]|nr:hypothetical protein [Novosphingobium beihaiensis]